METGLVQDREALVKETAALATQYDVVRFLRRVTETYGMRAFLVVRMPGGTAQTVQSVSVVSSWPAELMARYDRAAMLPNSPLFGRVLNTTVPFVIDLEQQAAGKSGREAEVLTLFKSYNMERVALLPVCDPDGHRGVVSFYGERQLPTHQEMLELTMIAIQVFDRLYQIGRNDHRPGEDLTEREIDCLNWTAAGKTSAEISEILGLSEHTVNHYLNRATRKLDTVNRTQAVAKAIRTGIIS
ncbi:MAG: LuxR family transcriptional regulator [Hyphomicrobiales bacterium]|nr:MAG: LuxR family transcriptional regulator [Hyphomicrobiales bacterium]